MCKSTVYKCLAWECLGDLPWGIEYLGPTAETTASITPDLGNIYIFGAINYESFNDNPSVTDRQVTCAGAQTLSSTAVDH